MKVRFIHHSSFLIETEYVILMFDYYKGALPPLSRDKPLYILCSHSHSDHYGKVIYLLPDNHPDVRYILSDDIPQKDIPGDFKSPLHFLKPHQEYRDENIYVRTLKSNDRGIAFVCETDGNRIYHGGDLNNWCWDKGKVAQEDERIYHEELSRIQGEFFDVALIPMDTRLKDYQLGIENFLDHADSAAIFPMHLWDKFYMIKELLSADTSKRYRNRVAVIERDGQEFSL